MRLSRTLIIAACSAASLLLFSACDETPDGCEEAKTATEALISDLCHEAAYVNTPFCTCCVANRYFSVGDDCTCRALVFDADNCYYAKGEQAKPQIRDAIEFANDVCNGRQVRVPFVDAGSDLCVSVTETSTSSSSSSSSTSSSSSSSSTSSSSGQGGSGG